MSNIIRMIHGNGIAMQIHRDTVLGFLRCTPQSDIYGEIAASYEELLPEVRATVKPQAIFGTDVIREGDPSGILPPGTEVLYAIGTVGEEVSELSKAYFDADEYVKGMLTDSMADAFLFAYESEILEAVRGLCHEIGRGVRFRYEAPTNIPIEMHRIALDRLQAEVRMGMELTSGYMFRPAKSSCNIFELTTEDMFHLEHDCKQCPRTECPLRSEN